MKHCKFLQPPLNPIEQVPSKEETFIRNLNLEMPKSSKECKNNQKILSDEIRFHCFGIEAMHHKKRERKRDGEC